MRACFLLALAAAALALPAASSAHRTDLTACELISPAKLASILGVEHVQIVNSLPGTSAKDNTSGVTHSVCNGVAWSGAKPTTRQAALLALATGRGAAFALDTWAPDEASTYVDRWTSKGFGQLINPAQVGWVELPEFGSATVYHVAKLVSHSVPGADKAFGLIGNPGAVTAIRAASGTWWSEQSMAIVSIVFADTASRPTVKQLNELAAIAVTAFGLGPLTLRQK